MTGLIVRIAGDDNYSIIDAQGNVTARNKIPRITSQGEVVLSNHCSPVIDGIFSLERKKSGDYQDYERERSFAVYKAEPNPKPIDGLHDLYAANVIMPDAFPICKREEHIKIIDKDGNVLGTINPFEGKEYHSISPFSLNGKFVVDCSDFYGLVNTQGEWVVKPEWQKISPIDINEKDYVARKDGKHYLISDQGQVTPWPFLDQFKDWEITNDYIIDEVFVMDNRIHVSNIYSRKTEEFLTSINDADYIRPNSLHPEIICARKGFDSKDRETKDRLIDISRSNATISEYYDRMEELPNGDYLGINEEGDTNKVWYVKTNGSSHMLPDNTRCVLRHPTNLSLYDTDFMLCVEGRNGSPGYLCDLNGNRLGNYDIEEWMNLEWEFEPVKNFYRETNRGNATKQSY